MRAGSRCLSIFTHTLNVRVLRAHAERPLRPRDLDEALGWAPQSSLRASVRELRKLGVLAPADPSGRSGELTAPGHELLLVADRFERWLRAGADPSISLEDESAGGLLRVLAAGWESGVIAALAAGPHTLTELNTAIAGLNYPALKRRVAKLRSVRLVEAMDQGGAAVNAVTEWLADVAIPLFAALRWERHHELDARPLARADAQTLLLLSLSGTGIDARQDGSCVLTVLGEGDRAVDTAAKVTIEVADGKMALAQPGQGAAPSAWALGTIDAWLALLLDGRLDDLRFGGARKRLGLEVVKGLAAATR